LAVSNEGTWPWLAEAHGPSRSFDHREQRVAQAARGIADERSRRAAGTKTAASASPAPKLKRETRRADLEEEHDHGRGRGGDQQRAEGRGPMACLRQSITGPE